MVDSVTITDNRNGQTIEIPIVDGGVSAEEWSKLLPGVWFYDPAFMTTAAAESAITFVDGDNGILEYRGYPIEQLTKQSTYLEVAYLLLHGELPTAPQLEAWVTEITYHTFIHENMRKRFLEGFHYDAHPMGILVSAIAALSTYYPDAKNIFDPEVRHKQIIRLIAKMPTLAAAAHRYSVGMPFVYPDNSHDFPSNFLSMVLEDPGVRVLTPTRSSCGRWTLSSSCTPTTSRTARRPRCASSPRPKSTPTRLVPRLAPPSTDPSMGARTRLSSACSPRSGPSRTFRTSSAR